MTWLKLVCDIQELISWATDKKGWCLSVTYVDKSTKYLWQCKEGHQWKATWSNVSRLPHGTWCPICSKKKLNNPLETLQKKADIKGGKILSVEYTNCSDKYLWQCKEGHQWKATWDNIRSDTWCAVCSKKSKPTLMQLEEYASSRNGTLISTEYVNNSTPLIWECDKKHRFKSSWNSCSNMNSWCQKCGYNVPDISILQKHAVSLGGTLISTEYITANLPLIWKCGKGHQWKATWGNIFYNNTWCPYCHFKTEDKCRNILETLTNISFKKFRFKNASNKYELDGYNKEHSIAFEYHGYQHYIYPNCFHKTKETFLAQQRRDKEKVEYCLGNNIILIIIPYTFDNNLENYIIDELTKVKLL